SRVVVNSVLAMPLPQSLKQRPRNLRLAALGAKRARCRTPAVDVEVSKCGSILYKAAQKQRGCDRAREGPIMDVIHVRDLAVEMAFVAVPEGHAPERIAQP